MPLDLDAIKARLAAATPGPWAQHPEVPRSIVSTRQPDSLLALDAPSDDGPYAVVDKEGDADFIAHAPTDIVALVAEVERLRALVPAPPKRLPPGEVWRHCGTRCIDGTDFEVDLVIVGAHQIITYYPSVNARLRHRCGYSPHPVVWVDGAIYWEDGLIATAQEEDFCAEVEEALIRYILEHGNPPDDFRDLGLDTFGRDVGIEVSHD